MVCLEASGNYSLDVALVLARLGAGVKLQVANPRRVRRFAESLGQRSKTDPVDARVLCQYAERMPLVEWQAPSAAALRLRALSRTIAALVRMCTQHKNRQHALAASAALPACLVRELEAQVRYTEKRIAKLRRDAVRLIASEPGLARRWQYLLSVPGLGESSALAVLAELAVLPDTLDQRQWVAHASLDPKHHESGSSIAQKPRISKAGNRYLRAALYMPALVAVQHDPSLRAFFSACWIMAKPSCRRWWRSCANCCMRLGECFATINLTMEPNCVRKPKKREVLRHLSREKKILKSKRESHRLKSVRDDNNNEGGNAALKRRTTRTSS